MVTRCDFEKCANRVAQIIGNCKACKGKWCLAHRLPEQHACTNMDDIKRASFETNKQTLMQQKTPNKKM
jgi:predicted nucleic acid binding AN1-type Zn finger protein